MSWLRRLLGGDKPHTPRSQLHRLGWPEPDTVGDAESRAVWPVDPPRPTVLESPEQAAERERSIKRSTRPGKPAQRGRRKRKGK